MSKVHSPSHFNGEADNFYDPSFALEINQHMKVPKSIRMSGDYTDEDIGVNGSSWNHVLSSGKLEMNVPDRILVVGQEQHLGTRAPPREIVLENAVMTHESGNVRVQTPPRVLTLDDHYFPSIDDSINDPEPVKAPIRVPNSFNMETQITRHTREQTPAFNALDVSILPSEEVQHLRRQMGKLNRRVMAIELELTQRQQREKFFYVITLTYFLLKAFSWLTRN